MQKRLLYSICISLLLFVPTKSSGAHKVSEYFSSYYGKMYDIYADSAAENIYVFIHSEDVNQLSAIVLCGKAEIEDFASRLDFIREQWNEGNKHKVVIPNITVRSADRNDWHTGEKQTLKAKWKKHYVCINVPSRKIDGFKQSKATIVFSIDELKQFSNLLRHCYHTETITTALPQDSNMILRY